MRRPLLELRQRDDRDGALRVTLVGELDIAQRDQVRAQLRQLRDVHRRVRLDLSQLDFIDCSGVDAILGVLTEGRGAGWELEVDRLVSPSVERIAALTGIASELWPAKSSPARAPTARVGITQRTGAGPARAYRDGDATGAVASHYRTCSGDARDALAACVREEIALRLERGASVAEVQDEVIEPARELSEDERAALWLFAWSYQAPARAPSRIR